MKHYFNYILVLILVIQCNILACSAEKSHDSKNKTIKIDIIAPFNYTYRLSVTGNELLMCDISYISDSVNKVNPILDTICAINKSRIDDLALDSIYKIVSNISEVSDSTEYRDAYLFELFLDDKLIIHKYKYDEKIFQIINIISPYIDRSKMTFPQVFDDVFAK